MICKHILLITFLNEPELIFFYKQLNGSKNCYRIRIILFTINNLFAFNKVVTSIAIQHYSFIHSDTFKCFRVLLCKINNSIEAHGERVSSIVAC